MANGYSQTFTILDIFNNPKLKGKIPLVNYKESVGNDGKIHKTTNMQSLTTLIYDTAKNGARPFYKPLKAVKSGNTITVGGNLQGDLNTAYNGVYTALLNNKVMFNFTVNNADIIRTALKESQRQKRSNGKEPKLWLKYNSIEEIASLSKRQLQFFIDDVMRNIFYNEDFAYTQKKYGVDKIAVNGSTDYARRRLNWQRKVGDI